MDHLKKLISQISWAVFAVMLLGQAAVLLTWFLTEKLVPDINPFLLLAALASVAIVSSLSLASFVANYVAGPVRLLQQAILHVSQTAAATPPPNLDSIKLGHELVTSLALEVYQLASSAPKAVSASLQTATSSGANEILDSLPVPIIILDSEEKITYANHQAQTYSGLKPEDVGKKLYDVFSLSFGDNNTLENWLETSRANKVTATNTWDRVKLQSGDEQMQKQFDLSAYYVKNSPLGLESILALYDRDDYYERDDQDISFMAMAVHELRTPLTIMRGYIEVFNDELSPKLDPQMVAFMYRMNAAAKQLTLFVNTILNVARVEQNQFVIHLHEANWEGVLKPIIDDLQLRANIYGIAIETKIAANMPAVAVDSASIYDVVANLIDNAIKYSGNGKRIIVSSQVGRDGFIETTVQDFGAGIPASVLPNIFEKFYRSHRSRNVIGGTGLGLFICKAIISAHGGNIWAQSKEGEGAVFGFSLQPYEQLADTLKNNDTEGIVRSAHGWIKNHDLYRK